MCFAHQTKLSLIYCMFRAMRFLISLLERMKTSGVVMNVVLANSDGNRVIKGFSFVAPLNTL